MDRVAGRTFEEYDAAVEWSRGAEADAVRISLPGFKREEIRVLVDNHGHLRTRGERPVAGTRWSRFQKDFQLPADCNVDGIRAKFENETLTITLPKKIASPTQPLTPSPSPPLPPPPQPEPRRPPAAPLPGVAKPPSPPSQRPPTGAERRSSLPRRPSISEPALPAPAPPPVPAPAPERVSRKRSDLGTLMKPKEEDVVEETTKLLPPPAAAAAAEEEEERMQREARGKMNEDRKMQEEKAKDAVAGVPDMAQLSRPASASRRQLVNVAVAVVVLLGITLYVWNALRNAAIGGAAGDHHGHGHGHASYSDEM
ncbi:predicted GPI-anchored protein 58 [Oryza brachyantha]|uniref:SHSP domain-containing protein n=1 Tax=Oryza brachyantha TaxID=4533 RepID=J3LR99_ORYBR|nr:predicted GPI-anchored protein 58 [Oryza brachyantha]